MEALQEAQDLTKSTFVHHVFSTTEEGKAEILNVVQYALMAVIPVVILNKIIQRFIPEADLEKSSLELLTEMALQITIMFCGIIVIHRLITYVPTYSGFKYETFTLTNAVLSFMVIILSIQSKLGIKANIVYDRALELWNGPISDNSSKKINVQKGVRFNEIFDSHTPSQADDLDESPMSNFPPMPISVNQRNNTPSTNQDSGPANYFGQSMGPLPANGILGNSFGSNF